MFDTECPVSGSYVLTDMVTQSHTCMCIVSHIFMYWSVLHISAHTCISIKDCRLLQHVWVCAHVCSFHLCCDTLSKSVD